MARRPRHTREVKVMRKRVCISLLALSYLISMAAGAHASAKSLDNMRAQMQLNFNVGDVADAETVALAMH